jgi:integrase
MFISRSTSGYYYIWFKDQRGKRKKVSTRCKRKGGALRFLQHFREEEHERLQKAKHVLLSTFIQEYLHYARANLARRTLNIHKYALNRLVALIGDMPIMSVTPRHFDLYKTYRSNMTSGSRSKTPQSVEPVTVNIDLRALRAAFSTAVRWQLMPKNPFAGLKHVFVPQQSPVFCTKDDVQRLLATISETWLKEIIVFAILTGMRRGEIVNLRWKDINLQKRTILVETNPTFTTKQGKKRIIPLNDTAFYLLQGRYGKENSEYVFTLNGMKIFDQWITHAFKKAVRAAKLEDDRIHFHSLRHTFASWLVQDGVSLYEVQLLLGHSSSRVTEVYSHLQPEMRHDTVNRIHVNLN